MSHNVKLELLVVMVLLTIIPSFPAIEHWIELYVPIRYLWLGVNIFWLKDG
jgi:hypothetical protein